MWDLENNQAAQLGLLSAGAAMFGSSRSGGDRINRSVQTGLNTYVPMMQWQQNKKDRKTDRDWNKQQDVIRNVLQERQFKMRSEAIDSEMENREARTNIARAQFGLAQTKMQNDLDMLEAQNKAMSQLYTAKSQGMPNPAAQGQFGPLVGNDPKTSAPRGVSPYIPATDEQLGMFGAKAYAAGGNKDAIEMLTQGSGGLMNPQSSQFKSANFNTDNILKVGQQYVDEGIAPNLARGIFMARVRLSQEQLQDAKYDNMGTNPLANIK
jgi:hypothetical protein